MVASTGFDESELVRLAASLEQGSEHPLAAALVTRRNCQQDHSGQCLRVSIEDRWRSDGQSGGQSAGGRQREASQRDWESDVSALAPQAEELRRQGQTVVFVAVDGRAAGVIGIADPIKPSTPQALRDLRAAGLRIVMLTGDSQSYRGGHGPCPGHHRISGRGPAEHKAEVVQRLQKEGRIVAMAGDGINDAPALAQADVGIAMGTGTDVAMESGGVTLVKGDLSAIVRARKLSQATMRNIRQNLFFAFIYNSIGVPIAAGVLYPFFGLLLSPILAAAAMSFSSVSVIANSLRLRRVKL